AHGTRRVRAAPLRRAVDRGHQPRARPQGERGETQHLPRGAENAARARAVCRKPAMTPTNLHLNDDDLVLHYYGEMPSAEEARAESHLTACDDCQQNYTRLQRVMAFVDSAPAVDAPDGFERLAWARLEPSLQTPSRGWLSWFVFSPARLAFAAGVIVLIGAAFMAGRVVQKTITPVETNAGVQSPEKVRERILLVDLGEHLDRSQMVLVELVSADEGKGNVDIS